MIDKPIIFENQVIKPNAKKIIDYINQHQSDFGELGSNYWQGRTIYLNQIKDPEIVQILKNHKDHMITEFRKLCNIEKAV